METIPAISFNKQTQSGVDGFEVINLEELLSRISNGLDHDPFQLHRLGFFALLIIQTGQVEHRVDFERVRMVEGDCLALAHGQVHAFDPQARYQGHLVVFSAAFLQKHVPKASYSIILDLFENHLGQIKFTHPKRHQQFLQAVKAEITTHTPALEASLTGARLTLFLLQLAAQKKQESAIAAPIRSQEQFIAFRQLLQSQYRTTRDANHYAAQLGMSYKHLNTICKTCIHQTAKAFIDHYVILEAKRLLVANSHSVKEISYTMGFDEPTNFQKYFKRQTGLSPLGFRKKHG